MFVKSLPACVKIIQASSLYVDLEVYDGLMNSVYKKYIGNTYNISLIKDICKINIIKKVHVILIVYHLILKKVFV